MAAPAFTKKPAPKAPATKTAVAAPRIQRVTGAEAQAVLKSAKSPVAAQQAVATQADRLLSAYGAEMDTIEKRHRLISTGMNSRERLSTGMLVPDTIMQGGLVPGMYQVSGPEQSAKSTLCMHVFGNALKSGLPIIQYWDAEGSLDAIYTGNILGVDLAAVFKGTPTMPRRARYYPNNVMEEFYNAVAGLLRVLPEKVFDEESNMWYYILPKRDAVATRLMAAAGMKPDRNKTTESHHWVPCEAGGRVEAVVFMDSYASLIPRATDEAEDPKSGMALVAREFSTNLRRVVGRLRNCGVCIFGVNQIRLKPGVMYGSPEYEPGGEALKFYSSVRNQIRARATPDGWERDKDTGQGVEASAFNENGRDLYAYKHIKNTKNKYGTPFRGGWMRVWTRDHTGAGRGFDPAFDTYEYLRMTNQISGTKKSFTIAPLASAGNPSFDYYTLKCLVLAEVTRDRNLMRWVMTQIGQPEGRVIQLRKSCFEQVTAGRTEALLSGGGGANFEAVDTEADDVEDI